MTIGYLHLDLIITDATFHVNIEDEIVHGEIFGVELKRRVIEICRQEASPYNVFAALICIPPVSTEEKKRKVTDTLVIIESSKPFLRHTIKHLGLNGSPSASLLLIDRKTFEKDVEKDLIGGFAVESLLTPYEPLINGEYLWRCEVEAKKKIVKEALRNLVSEYPEMSREMLIKPEYFLFQALARKASLYPPIICKFLNIVSGEGSETSKERVMLGFIAALDEAAKEGLVTFSDGYIKITGALTGPRGEGRAMISNIFVAIRNSLLRHGLEVFPKLMRSLISDYMLLAKHFLQPGREEEGDLSDLLDPEKYVFIPTPSGHVSLSEKVTLEEFAKKNFPGWGDSHLKIERIGGILNTVYKLTVKTESGERSYAVKVFKDWYGWKWFPIALWTFGTRSFSVLGKKRLEKEYAINRFLSREGFNVPEIIFMSPKERLIFQEYVEGESLLTAIRMADMHRSKIPETGALMRRVGGEIARVHNANVALGDCKPENILLTPDGKIFFVDLEQGEIGGDQAWDIAEMLFYIGHYAPLLSADPIRRLTGEFLDGYLGAGGDRENIRRAISPGYVKVFSFFTSPHIIYAITKVCKDKLQDTIDSRKIQDG
ncbi:MAG: lipopolysaccharide kinase InaA family protein [Nitrososphaerota archaeon]|nr:hypothetical protein [Candidatus Bathyarchaeota archaeon]MDW8048161.1 lipopolysaccharide kinase InaA family protein [Nitrososphaerota archaeon]